MSLLRPNVFSIAPLAIDKYGDENRFIEARIIALNKRLKLNR